MVLGIEAVHKQLWIHRDIKPDNFLISASGHLKISDFGLAFDSSACHCQGFYSEKRQALLRKFDIKVDGDLKDIADLDTPMPDYEMVEQISTDSLLSPLQSRRQYARSIVGTSQYMAPEIIVGDPYDGRCDWWSLGVIVFEMLYGFTPFYDESRLQTKENIVSHTTTLDFPDGRRLARPHTQTAMELSQPSNIALSCMSSLMADRHERLGSKAYMTAQPQDNRRDSGVVVPEATHVQPCDADEVKAHPFFAEIPWSTMHKRTPPWVPDVDDDLTKYFEDEDQMMDVELTPRRPRDKLLRDPVLGPEALQERRKAAFIGYTYRRPTEHARLSVFGIPGFSEV